MTEDDPDLPYIYDVRIPQVVGHPDREAEDAINQALRRPIEEMIAGFVEWSVELGDEFGPSSLYVEFEVTLQNDNLLSIVVLISDYASGAAHPNSGYDAYVFALDTGTRLSMDDFLEDGAEAAFTNRIADEVAAAFYDGSTFEVYDWTGGQQELFELAKLWLAPGRIGAAFDQYAVGPSVIGPVRVDLDLGAVALLLDPDGPLGDHPEVVAARTSAPSSRLELRRDGLGTVSFGDDAESAAAALEAILGPPEQDSGWVEWFCLAGLVRDLRWPGLHVLFTEGPTRWSTAGPHMVFYAYFLEEGGDPLGLTTADGIGLGSTIIDLESAYGNALEINDRDTVFGPVFVVADPELGGGYRVDAFEGRIIWDDTARPFWGGLSGTEATEASIVMAIDVGTDVCDLGPGG